MAKTRPRAENAKQGKSSCPTGANMGTTNGCAVKKKKETRMKRVKGATGARGAKIARTGAKPVLKREVDPMTLVICWTVNWWRM